MSDRKPALSPRGDVATAASAAAAQMTPEQTADLKRLSDDAREPEAFSAKLTQAEARVRINALTAKLRLQDEPPHTL